MKHLWIIAALIMAAYLVEFFVFTDVGVIKYLFLLFVSASFASLLLRTGYESRRKDIITDILVGVVPLIIFLVIHLL